MADNNPLGSAPSGVDNTENVRHLSHEIQPTSNIVGSVLEVFYNHGYINGFEFVDNGRAGSFEVEPKGAISDCGVVKPRYSAGADDFGRWEKRFLPVRDCGALTITTSHDVMSHYGVRKKGIGG